MIRAVVLALVLAACLGGCGREHTDTRGTRHLPPCQGGDVRLLQGIPTDLPGGGGAGIGQVDERGRTVRLVLRDQRPEERPPGKLKVGDTFSVAGVGFRIACISPSVVTLDRSP